MVSGYHCGAQWALCPGMQVPGVSEAVHPEQLCLFPMFLHLQSGDSNRIYLVGCCEHLVSHPLAWLENPHSADRQDSYFPTEASFLATWIFSLAQG
jgi:hypothetical protein